MSNKEIFAIGGAILTVLLAVFFWISIWVLATTVSGWIVGMFACIVSLVGLGVATAFVLRFLSRWAELDPNDF